MEAGKKPKNESKTELKDRAVKEVLQVRQDMKTLSLEELERKYPHLDFS